MPKKCPSKSPGISNATRALILLVLSVLPLSCTPHPFFRILDRIGDIAPNPNKSDNSGTRADRINRCQYQDLNTNHETDLPPGTTICGTIADADSIRAGWWQVLANAVRGRQCSKVREACGHLVHTAPIVGAPLGGEFSLPSLCKFAENQICKNN